MDQVFHLDNGILKDNPCIESIYAIRQLTLIFSKIEIPCTPERERRAMREYVLCDKEVNENDSLLDDSDFSELSRLGSLLFGPLLTRVDSDIYNERIVPRHGPGATADRLTSNGKYYTVYWTERLEKVFHVGDFLSPSPRFQTEDWHAAINHLEPGSEMPSRVISVPKTQKTPRIIAIEPSSVQYVQQGILESLNKWTDRDLIGQFISSSSQEPNQLLAKEGSHGSLATLDLSEASDRVSFRHVTSMLNSHPLAKEAMTACRTLRADVPGEGIIPLSKFASMGSALCFPLEAMVFLTMIFLGVEKERGYRFVDRKELLPFVNQVRVYGDDIIVPVDYVHTVIETLEYFGARVNRRKSFWTGRFRESCGKEYFDGHDVSIVKLRGMFPSSRQRVAETVKLVAFRNHLYQYGCWATCQWLDEILRKLLRHFPCIEPTSSALGRVSFLGYQAEKWHDDLHVPLVRACVISARSPADRLDDRAALLKFFLKRSDLPRFDAEHLERAGRPRTAYIKTRWVTPY